jgi:hypothetical protein
MELQKFTIPENCRIIRNNFSTYDPEKEYSEEKNILYLTEDLLQIEVGNQNLLIDLGWYGEIHSNQGEFKLFVIKNQDWENPLVTESSKSQKIITKKFENILKDLCNKKDAL